MKYYCEEKELVLKELSASDDGLRQAEAERRLEQDGKNRLAAAKGKSLFRRFLEQLADPMILILLAAAAVSGVLAAVENDSFADVIIILAVVVINAILGVYQESKAEKAIEALQEMSAATSRVLRGGQIQTIPSEDLVKGDIILLEAGDAVPADARILESASLKVEEAALTGESVPVTKFIDMLKLSDGQKDVPLGDRKNMVYMGSTVVYGRGRAVVTATGMQTEMGKIADALEQAQEGQTPLQRKLSQLSRILTWIVLAICVVVFAVQIIRAGRLDLALALDSFMIAVSLAVAAIPEGLAAVVTVVLSIGVTNMSKRNAIIRRLTAVETLGCAQIICSDKTGTLTQNRMTVEKCFLNQRFLDAGELAAGSAGKAPGGGYEEFLRGLTLCNDATLEGEERFGDPTELALLDLAAGCGIRRQTLEKKLPRTAELPFDSNRKMMSTFHRNGSESVTYTKGAPDEILKKCTRILLYGKEAPLQDVQVRQILSAVEKMSGQALRTLAVAMRRGGNRPEEENLTFIGMVGMKDPPRPEAAEAVERFRRAGVTTVMITGDHVDTAYAIAAQLGIVKRREQCMTETRLRRLPDKEFLRALEDVRVFARVSPQSKVRIVKGFKAKGKIVAMTGDGVNDAPSLKAADIGIAMGESGTDVAKQASEIILTDDNFATIEKAIEEGRGVYENIKKSVIFLLSSNLGEIMTMFTAVLMGLASPLKSSHILWINLITDSLPALALGADDNDADSLMKKPPRDPKESLFADGGLARTCFYGLLIAGISLTAFFTIPYGIMRERGIAFSPSAFAVILQNEAVLSRAQTYAFTVLGMSQLFHAIGMRDVEKSVFRMNHLRNRLMLLALAAGFLLQIAVTEIPFLTAAFGTAHLSLREWLRLLILAAFPLLAHELFAFFPETGRKQD